MKKILIVTHAKFASGIKSTIELLSGSKDNITTIDAFIDDTNIMQEISGFINSVATDDQAFIFTDIKYGSVNQTVTNLLAPFPDNIFVITGFNLPVLLELCLTDEVYTNERVIEIVNQAREEMLVMNFMENNNSDDEDFFE